MGDWKWPALKPEDLKLDSLRFSEHGVRVRHKPTGLIITKECERNQLANRNAAYDVLNKAVAALDPTPTPADRAAAKLKEGIEHLELYMGVNWAVDDVPPEDLKQARIKMCQALKILEEKDD